MTKREAWERLKNENPELARLLINFRKSFGAYRLVSIKAKTWAYPTREDKAA